jgi:hypothetical protein
MKHALWIVLLTAACGHDGATNNPEPVAKATERQNALVLSRDATSLQVIQRPKGRMVRLGDAFQSAAIIRRTADGTLQTECFDESAGVEAFMAGAPASSHSNHGVQ